MSKSSIISPDSTPSPEPLGLAGFLQPEVERNSVDLEAAFLAEEWRGLRIAVIGRFIALFVVSIALIWLFPAPAVYFSLSFVAGLAVSGLLQLWVGRPGSRLRWARGIFLAIDMLLIVTVIITPNPWSNVNLPPQSPMRFGYVIFTTVLLASVTFTYSPRLVLFSGLALAAAWLGVGVWIGDLPDTVTFANLPTPPSTDDLFALFGIPTFFDPGKHMLEAVALVLLAGLLAVAVWRARIVVRRVIQLEREQDRIRAEQSLIREIFGKYVPEGVASAILEDKGTLRPELKTATVLFADIEGFTTMGESLAPENLLALLNEYFDCVARIVADHGGVITQFQGDAILATFNVPVDDPHHADAAVKAAMDMRHACRDRRFAGTELSVRVGVNTGRVVAGSVGGANRLNYTVHGDAVNIAARLEQMNKDLGTGVLISGDTTALLTIDPGLREVGSMMVRGKSTPVTVHALR